MNRKQKNIKLFILASLLLIVLLMFLVGCGSQQADDVDMDSTMEEMCPTGFEDCRAMTERELDIWFFTIDCLKSIDLFPVFIDANNIEPPKIREEEDVFMCGEVLAVGCAHPTINLIRVRVVDAFFLEEAGRREGLFAHEDGHILLFLANNDITHESIFYTMPELCINPSQELF